MHITKKKIPLSATNKNSVALKNFFKITRIWNLSSEQERVLLGVPKPTYYCWKNKKEGDQNYQLSILYAKQGC